MLDTFSFRGQALFSDLDVPWDAPTLEYGWLMEICVGQLLGKLHSSQVSFYQLHDDFFSEKINIVACFFDNFNGWYQFKIVTRIIHTINVNISITESLIV